MIDVATSMGADDVVIGMAHRGRLNVLANVMRKPMEMIFGEFKGIVEPDADQDKEDWSMSGDVKYHLGSTYKRKYPDGRKVTLSLLANPSHLEAVNPLSVERLVLRCTIRATNRGNRFFLF